MIKTLVDEYDAKVKEIDNLVKAKGELITTAENQEKLISMQKQALALGDAIETAVKLKDLDNRLSTVAPPNDFVITTGLCDFLFVAY
jgi:hypothetical protein